MPIAMADGASRLQLLDEFEAGNIGWFWATDDQNRLIYLSPPAAATFQASHEDLIGRPLASLFTLEAGDDEEAAERPLPFLLSARTKFANMIVKVDAGGETCWWTITGKPYLNPQGTFLGYRGGAKDITADFERQRDNTRAAQFDSLTGLANRNRMTRRLTAILTAYKVAKRSCALLMLDLDRFKAVNDTLGHPAGDELLKQVAQRLERIVGTKGEIGRLGGDEFQIILPDMDDRGDLGDLAHRIIQMISQPYSLDGSRAIIGTSVGIAVAPYDGIEPSELVKAADLALYAAKGGGRGQYRFYSNDLKDIAHQRREIEEDLRDALSRGELKMHYQPVVCAKTHKVKGFEALMRWEHPERGSISPAVFIPIAEETNLIIALGEWAMRQACEDSSQWPGDLTVSVNVSAQQFSTENLPTLVTNALSSSGLKPSRLELEITESVFMGDAAATDAMFAKLKRIGVRLALDDFGTGYSSLGYLRKAPFDKIKIDQSFVRGSTEPDNSNSAIIAAIVSLANALDMETTAEGVEAMDELALVQKRGATLIQGFIFSRAVPQEEVLEKLSDGNFIYQANGPEKQRSQRRTVFRRIGVIHEDHRYDAVLRNLSRTGAMIEGLLEVPVGTDLVLDLGEGQLAICRVRRSQDATQGVEFETPLVSDGSDGLCTRHRISPYALAAAGMPLAALPPGHYSLPERRNASHSGQRSEGRRFVQVDVAMGASRAA
ncbi:EAL domain-containing protein [Altererythrobacter salegens]|uniref:EAL domain-containing protein n=2 Tax=Croceibacterium salegens TaxID=1737568 RepID=A0A6I4SWD3_9SPHN|nr:EAL domain-containing protein [Croceibacterium salegens]